MMVEVVVEVVQYLVVREQSEEPLCCQVSSIAFHGLLCGLVWAEILILTNNYFSWRLPN